VSAGTVPCRRATRSDPVGPGPASTDGPPTPLTGPRAGPCYRAPVEATLTEPSLTTPGDAGSRRAPIEARWLGRVPYPDAHALQKRLVDDRAAERIGDQLLLLEHPAVLTLGKHSDPSHILATPDELRSRGVAVEHVERGGEVTYHGPGQLVAYPIVRLHERGLLLRPFVRALEVALIDTCAALGVPAGRRDGHPGCWCDADGPIPRKIGALGLRVERGISYHGIALNVTVDLGDFDLIDACGMPGVASTSIARELGRPTEAPSTGSVERAAPIFARAFAAAIDAPLAFTG
jgi:lipoyl(octanoyl) transferase